MTEEELPDYLDDLVIDTVDRGSSCEHAATDAKHALRAAIRRYVSEREAAVLDQAARECLQAKPSWNRNDLAERILALKTKEPATTPKRCSDLLRSFPLKEVCPTHDRDPDGYCITCGQRAPGHVSGA